MTLDSKSQLGRSLIELLLVLAVMAVLTIGGIAGYNALSEKSESRTIVENINRHVIERQHEAMTSKGRTEHVQTDIEGPHGVKFDISNDIEGNVIVITVKSKDLGLIQSVAKADMLKRMAKSIEPPVLGEDENAVTMRFYRNAEDMLKCPAHALCEGETFTCKTGYHLNSTGDGCETDCSTWLNGTECSPLCPEYATCNGITFICIEGYYQSGESCLECITDGSETCETCTDESTPYWDGENCVSAICPPNSSTTETSEEIDETGCYCNAGYIVNAAGNGCVAETTCSADNDTCGEGYYCNTTTNKCAVNTCTIENSSPTINGTQIGETGCYCKTGYIVNATGDGCVSNGHCPTGTTWDGEGTAATALENGHCKCTSYTENVCGPGYYCNFDSSANDCRPDSARGIGICKKITETELNNGYSSGTMNWWSAYSFCKGLPGNKSMPTLAQLDIQVPRWWDNKWCDFPNGVFYLSDTGYSKGSFLNENAACKSANGTVMTPDNAYKTKWAELKGKYSVDYFWTQDLEVDDGTSNSCNAFFVELDFGEVVFDYRNYDRYAVCE